MKSVACLVVALAPGLAWANDEAPNGGTKVAPFTLRDYRGAETSLDQFATNKVVVLAFVGCEYPVARLYGPRLAKLAKDYGPRGVQFLGVDANQQRFQTSTFRAGPTAIPPATSTSAARSDSSVDLTDRSIAFAGEWVSASL
jgi:hypothetical protein